MLLLRGVTVIFLILGLSLLLLCYWLSLFFMLGLLLFRFRFSLLPFGWLGRLFVLCRLGCFFVMLFLRESWNCGSEEQEHSCCANDSKYFHQCCLHYREFMRAPFFAGRGLLFAFDELLSLCRLLRLAYAPTWIREKAWNSPKTFSNHKTTAITTTAFKIDLIVPCIGMKRLINQSRTPTTISTITI